MASSHVRLVLLCGELWRSLSAEPPLRHSTRGAGAPASTRGPRTDRATTYEPQATTPSLHPPGTFDAPREAPDGTWLAALLIGTILAAMIVVIALILLWNCCKKPRPVDTNWAGRSPFADGDMPEVFAELEQTTKRSSILSMLPWKPRQEASAAADAGSPEGRGPRAGVASVAAGVSAAVEAGAAAGAGAAAEAGVAMGAGAAVEAGAEAGVAMGAGATAEAGVAMGAGAAAEAGAEAGTAMGAGAAAEAGVAMEASTAVPPSPAQEPCTPPAAAAECPELPPPPAWLQEAALGSGPGLGGQPLWETPPLPPPPAPELAAPDVQEPPLLPDPPLYMSAPVSDEPHVS